jgi:hypothetical protein
MSERDMEGCINESSDIDFTIEMIPTTLTLTIINMVVLAGNRTVE